MGSEQRRYNDEALVELKDMIINLEKTVSEIHQRQTETTLPTLEKISHAFYGNGKEGLLTEHIRCQGRIEDLLKLKSQFIGVIISFALMIAATIFNWIWGLLHKS